MAAVSKAIQLCPLPFSLSTCIHKKDKWGFFFFFLFMQFLLRYCIFIVRGTNIKINVLSSPFSKWTTNLSNNLIFYIYITLSSHTITRLALPLGYTTFLVFFFFLVWLVYILSLIWVSMDSSDELLTPKETRTI